MVILKLKFKAPFWVVFGSSTRDFYFNFKSNTAATTTSKRPPRMRASSSVESPGFRPAGLGGRAGDLGVAGSLTAGAWGSGGCATGGLGGAGTFGVTGSGGRWKTGGDFAIGPTERGTAGGVGIAGGRGTDAGSVSLGAGGGSAAASREA